MIVIDPNRFNGAQFALRLNSKITGFILDDGFQHQQLSRNLNILLLDVEMYFKQPGLLPLGRFRENFKAIKRADHILLTKWDFQSQKAIDQLVAKIKKHNIDYDFLESKIARVENHKGINLKSKKIILMSGLGQPSVFEKDFMKSYPDVKIIQHYKYKDHYNYTSEDIENILNLTNTNNCELVCSEKDYIKIQALELGLDQIYYTIQELQIGERLTSKIQKLFKRD
jgi:tetraacyldisaccharide 4'-kinase